MLLQKFASYLKTEPGELQFRPIMDTVLQADDGELLQSLPEFSEAQVVEDDGLHIYSVGDGNHSDTAFSCFLDGIERKQVLGDHDSLVPIVYGYAAAVIRQRGEDRRLSNWRMRQEELLYFPFDQVDPGRMLDYGIDACDTRESSSEASPLHPMMLLESARRAINKRREQLERKLAEEWMRSHIGSDDWLLVDGSITASYELHAHPHVVGVIKSHQTQLFKLEDQRKILRLKPGERSSVFEPRGKTRTPVYSWYLRLHPNTGRDPYFGLIRVEAAKSPETLKLVDRISSWLMTERQPLALPDGRWDKLLYPIRDCEQYLKSIAPSRIIMEAALAGL